MRVFNVSSSAELLLVITFFVLVETTGFEICCFADAIAFPREKEEDCLLPVLDDISVVSGLIEAPMFLPLCTEVLLAAKLRLTACFF